MSDGKGGAIITWEDYTGVYHIYAQKISGDGKVVWLKDGVAISTATGNQVGPKLVRDGQGGAIIAFVNNIERDDRPFCPEGLLKRTTSTRAGVFTERRRGHRLRFNR